MIKGRVSGRVGVIWNRSYASESSSVEGSEEGGEQSEGGSFGRQEKEEATTRVVRDLHLQGSEAGAPGHGNQLEGDEHHEQFRERHIRAHCRGSVEAGTLQPAIDDHEPRDPDGSSSASARRTGEARRERRNEGRDEVHVIEVNGDGSSDGSID